MSKPEDIPQDVWGKAFKFALEYRASVLENGSKPHDLTNAIARIILAAEAEERNKAINAAAEFLHLGTDLSIAETETLSAGIAAAIRRRSKAP